MKKLTIIFLSIFMVFQLAYASGNKEEKQAPIQDTIKMSMASDIDSFDPFLSVAYDTQAVNKNIFEGLMTFDENGNCIPSLSESYDVSNDGLLYTFHLRHGVTFHDGTPFTSKDVVYSINRYAGLDGKPAILDTFSQVKAVQAIDDFTVAVTMKTARFGFIYNTIQPIVKAGYENNAELPIGTGPYKFVSYTAGQKVVLERNDAYWGDKANIKNVEIYFITDSAATISALQSGQIDFGMVLPDLFAPLAKNYDLVASPMNMTDVLALNNDVAPFDKVKVRQAIYYALDRQEIMDGAFGGKAVPIYSPVSSTMSGYVNSTLSNTYPLDREKARTLLSEAGYPNGFAMTITVPANYVQHVDTAQILVSQLAQVGIDVTIDSVEWGTWLEKVYSNRNYQSTIIGMTSLIDPVDILQRYTSESKKNFYNYRNPQFDAAIDEALASQTNDNVVKALQKAQQIVSDDAGAVWLCDPEMTAAVNKKLGGYKFYYAGYFNFSALYYK